MSTARPSQTEPLCPGRPPLLFDATASLFPDSSRSPWVDALSERDCARPLVEVGSWELESSSALLSRSASSSAARVVRVSFDCALASFAET